MLSNISKVELVKRAKKMRETTNKESLLPKKKVLASVVRVQSEKDEHTTLGLFFKRKRLETTPPFEHSHSDGRAPDHNVLIIQECEVVGSSKGKSLWDPNFDILAHDVSCFLPAEDKAKLMVHDEDHLCQDSKKLLGQAVALACLANIKARDRKKDEARGSNKLPNSIRRLNASVVR